ncbi:hypothetical protein GCM10018791_02900 [Streptomyces zaomyceticus]|nr:hypothetical protein GCM10018791_02900 [Streptomyces zaomyceticus]
MTVLRVLRSTGRTAGPARRLSGVAPVERFSAVRRIGEPGASDRGPLAPQVEADVDEFHPFQTGDGVERVPGGEVGGTTGLVAQLTPGDPRLVDDPQALEVAGGREAAQPGAADGVDPEEGGGFGETARLSP